MVQAVCTMPLDKEGVELQTRHCTILKVLPPRLRTIPAVLAPGSEATDTILSSWHYTIYTYIEPSPSRSAVGVFDE